MCSEDEVDEVGLVRSEEERDRRVDNGEEERSLCWLIPVRDA